MKKTYFLSMMFALIVAAMGFLACENDDDNESLPENHATIHGTVVNSITGELVPTATVELYKMAMYSEYLVTTMITGTDGFFSFQNIEFSSKYEATYIIEVSHPDFRPYSQAVKLKPGSKLEINASIQPKN